MPFPLGDQAHTSFSGLKDLGLDQTLLSWSDVSTEQTLFIPTDQPAHGTNAPSDCLSLLLRPLPYVPLRIIE